MIRVTFDQEKHAGAMKKDWHKAGRVDGLREGQELEREKGIRRLTEALQKIETTEEYIRKTLQKQYGLSEEETEKYVY